MLGSIARRSVVLSSRRSATKTRELRNLRRASRGASSISARTPTRTVSVSHPTLGGLTERVASAAPASCSGITPPRLTAPGSAIGCATGSTSSQCVFVGMLYNKMRVRKDLWAELKNLFLSFADPTSVALKVSSEALQVAENDVSLKCKALDAEEAALTAARKLIQDAYDERRKAVLQAADVANQQIADASNAAQQLLDQVSEMERQVAGAARQVFQIVRI
jgi:hypothetical protein